MEGWKITFHAASILRSERLGLDRVNDRSQ